VLASSPLCILARYHPVAVAVAVGTAAVMVAVAVAAAIVVVAAGGVLLTRTTM
jgi:hypothetical protein